MEEIRVPTIGENIESGEVVKVLVAVGDRIAAEQPLLELETDKAVVEIPAPRAGTVKKILVKAGDTIKIGQAIVELEPEAGAKAAPEPARKAKPAAQAETPAPAGKQDLERFRR